MDYCVLLSLSVFPSAIVGWIRRTLEESIWLLEYKNGVLLLTDLPYYSIGVCIAYVQVPW